MTPIRDRPMADIIVLVLVLVVAFVMIFATIGVGIAIAMGNAPDIDRIARAIGNMVASLIGVLCGYLVGRNVEPKQ